MAQDCRRFGLSDASVLSIGVVVKGKAPSPRCEWNPASGSRQSLLVMHATGVRSSRTALTAHSKRSACPSMIVSSPESIKSLSYAR